MKNVLKLSLTGLLLTGCATVVDSSADYPAFTVTAAFETPVVNSVGDAADDPAIYNGENGAGFIAGTDKQAGLYIYNLDGTERDFMPIGEVNNVDLREGFVYDGVSHVLLVASDDETNSIVTILYNPKTDEFMMPQNSRLMTGSISPYGICLGKMADGSFHVGATTKSGVMAQYEITANGPDITLQKRREISTGKQTEGCDFDDRTGSVYLAVEVGALMRYDSDPNAASTPIEIARIGQYGLMADLEGVTVYPKGDKDGYVIVSSQGNNSYGVFKLPRYEFAGRFEIMGGTVDAVSTTDGIAVTSQSTARFPKGFLVVQDDMDNTSPSEAFKKQNFKIIDWRDIESQLSR